MNVSKKQQVKQFLNTLNFCINSKHSEDRLSTVYAGASNE